jgi:hypothetical protein
MEPCGALPRKCLFIYLFVRVRSVGLAYDEERETQGELFKQFKHGVLTDSSDSLKVSTSEDENEVALPPDLNEGSAVQAISGDGLQIVQEEDAEEAPVTWSGWPTMVEQFSRNRRRRCWP